MPPARNGAICSSRTPATNISMKPTAAMTTTEPKSGSRRTGTAMPAMIRADSNAPRLKSSTRQPARSSQTASETTVASLANSLGCRRMSPRSIHRWEPLTAL